MLVSRAIAVIRGRDFVTPDDVKAIAPAVLGHRINLRPELWMSNLSTSTIVDELLSSVPAPSVTVAPARVDG